MIRELINRFNRSLSERLVANRRKHAAPMRVWFEPDINTPHHHQIAKSMAIPGETVDMSRTGIAFVVSSIRVQEKYLVGQDRKLHVEIDLPSGRVEMQVVGKRYEKVGIHLSDEKFLIGANIVKLETDSNPAYDHFLKNGARKPSGTSSGLELGID
ncbi:MAG: PilZ domain-containing protein [Blastocatellia bacterium]|nr:PilZ domain-containing protein [Blastocatellia bacterium]